MRFNRFNPVVIIFVLVLYSPAIFSMVLWVFLVLFPKIQYKQMIHLNRSDAKKHNAVSENINSVNIQSMWDPTHCHVNEHGLFCPLLLTPVNLLLDHVASQSQCTTLRQSVNLSVIYFRYWPTNIIYYTLYRIQDTVCSYRHSFGPSTHVGVHTLHIFVLSLLKIVWFSSSDLL